MLVVEEWHGLSAIFIDLDDLLEILVARIFCLTFFIAWIPAMFADQHDSVDCELAAAKRKRFGDSRAHFHGRESGGTIGNEIALAMLLHVKGDEVHGGMVMFAIPAISF